MNEESYDLPSASALRLARPLLIGHIALISFSTIALITFLAGPVPSFLQTGMYAEIYHLGWKFSGPTYVVLGALAALAHATGLLGARRAFGMLVVATLVSLGAELLGTGTGYPFGPYEYTALLGYRIAGLVPFPIPLSWFFMIYCSLAICGRLLPASDDLRTRIGWALAGGAILTAWDVSMDPAMSKATLHWVWHTSGFFYGMPLTNWAGWFLTGSIVAFAMLTVTSPTAFASRVSPTSLPIALYAINGVMPIALCLRHGLWWAAALGVIAMGVPLVLAMRSGPIEERQMVDLRMPVTGD